MLLKHNNSDDSAFIVPHLSHHSWGSFKSNLYKILKQARGNLSPVSTFSQKPCFSEVCNTAVSTMTCLCWVTRTWTSGVRYPGAQQLKTVTRAERYLSGTVLLLKTGIILRPFKKEREKNRRKRFGHCNTNFHDKAVMAGACRHNRSSKSHHAPHWKKKIQERETRQQL